MRGTDRQYMKANRLGILAIFADNGKIEPATIYLAKGIADIVAHLCVVINGNPDDDAIENIKSITESVFVRENRGYDSGAFKFALEEVLGWEELYKYGELVLVNDSCFGPIYPLEDMFREMENRNCDFWGVTDQPVIKRNKFSNALLPYHIQSYFLVIRERMMKSLEFINFWKHIRLSDMYELAVDNFELVFTEYFGQCGYKADSYIDGKMFCQSVEETQAYVFFDSFRLIKEYKCPLLKKKAFLFSEQDILASNAGETARKTLEFVDKETYYDADLIWDYLIKKSDLYELKSVLHLDYICSKEQLVTKKTEDYEIAIILFAWSNELLDQCRWYVGNLEQNVHVYLILQREQKDFSELLLRWYCDTARASLIDSNNVNTLYEMVLGEYKYVCVIDEMDEIQDNSLRQLYVNTLLENAIGSSIYVQNVLELFRCNKKLGVLTLPRPYFSNHFIQSFQNDAVNGFWGKTACLQCRQIIEKNDEQKHIHREMPIRAAKESGYYIGEVYTEEYASYFITEYSYILNHLIRNFLLEQGVEEFRYLYNINTKLLDFIRRYQNIYIYGAGEYGVQCIHYLEENNIFVQGIIVSEGMKYAASYLSYPIYEFTEIILKEDIGIIIALNEKNTQMVVHMLERNSFNNYIQFSE